MNIKITLKDADKFLKIDYRHLKPLQGNLKDLTEINYNKLKKSMEEFGYFVPVYVWTDADGIHWIEDGHGRLRLFTREHAQFYYESEEEQEFTYEIPVIGIEAKDRIEAKEKLLVISSQYQTVTQEGYDEYVVDLNHDWLIETTHFDVLSFEYSNIQTDEPTLPEEKGIFRVYVETDSEPVPEEICKKLEELGYKPKVSRL